MTRPFAALFLALAAPLLAGCQQPELNPTMPTTEDGILSEPIQLTKGFSRAGECYFSPDMKWVIFQASVKDEDYQMYVAQLKWEGGRPVGLHTPIRISPDPSWNSCGWFSPDGNSIIFGSTALKPQPKEMPGGYQRDRRDYRWSMPAAAEVIRADGWKGAVSALPPGGSTNLAKHALTNNDAHNAECSYSPDGKWIVYAEVVNDLPLPPAPTGELVRPTGGSPGAAAPATTRPTTAAARPPKPNVELFVMKPDGSKQTRLTRVAGYDGGPFFSPDGKRLVYRSDRKGNDLLQVFVADLVFDANGDVTGIANERQLTNDAHVNWAPYWHPDGRHIIYGTSAQGHSNYELYLMRDDGSHKTRVTFTGQNVADVLPVFSPDGKWLMWTSQRGDERVPDPRNPGETRRVSEIWIARFTMPKGA